MADYENFGDYGYGNYPPPSYGYGPPRGGHGGNGGAMPYNGYPGQSGPPASGYGPPPGVGGFDAGYQQSPLDAEVATVLHEMRTELSSMDLAPEFGDQYRNAKRLLTSEVTKLENNVDPEWLELDIEKQIKLVKKVLIPAFRHPRFNFVGKVIGPKGVTLQNIAKTFKCHVYVLGRGSSRDRNKEQELLASGDPQYAHYNGPLHVKIETTAPPALAYKRVAGVLEVLGELLKPVKETYIEGITPAPESFKKEDGDSEEGNKEPVEESKIKIDGDYGPDMPDTKSQMNNRGGPRGGGGDRRGGGRGAPRGGGRGGRGSSDEFRGPPSMNRGGGPMRRGGGGMGGNSGHFASPGYGGGMPMGAPRGPAPLMRGSGGRGMRGGPDRGRGGSRFQPY